MGLDPEVGEGCSAWRHAWMQHLDAASSILPASAA